MPKQKGERKVVKYEIVFELFLDTRKRVPMSQESLKQEISTRLDAVFSDAPFGYSKVKLVHLLTVKEG